YPEGTLAAQVLGFVNHDGIGQYGVEQFYNEQLSGKDGVLQTVTDVSKIPLTIGAKDISIPAEDGEDLVLSIDRNIQSQAEQVLASGLKNAQATTGSMIVMDPQTGRVLAMANLPSYDPADYGNVESTAVYQNNTISNAYEPGSIMKLFTVGTGLNEGVITPSTTYYNNACIQVDDAKICNVEKSVSGMQMSPMQILQYSLNTGAVWVLEQLGGGQISLTGRQKLYDYLANNYRMNALTGIDLANEVDSVIYKPNTTNGPRVLYANMTFGQGEQLTMIQVASAFSAVINGGNYYQPTVVKGTLKDGQKVEEKQAKLVAENVLKPDISNTLKDMLYQARYLGAGGRYKDNGYYVGGKSGTAQNIDPATGAYSDTLTTGTYLGFGADKTKTPKYVIMVRVDDAHNGGYSGSAAAQPIFDQMSNFMIQYEGVSK
ncbi:MAG: penicillin-binding protein 2, partial [Candidatus Saccharibacteria bacterium]|nr:penicillin-binding protein 2 [Candidatus Saccharibacteria bacterium]